MGSASRKRKREPPCQISKLPDELLGRILAELPIRHRIRVERVSKRWQLVGKTFAWSTETALQTNTAEHEFMIEAVLDRCGDCSRIRELRITNSRDGRISYDALNYAINRCVNLSSISFESPNLSPRWLRNCEERVGKLLECIRGSETCAKHLKSLRLNSLNELAIDGAMELLGKLTQLETLKVEYDHQGYIDHQPVAPQMKKLRMLDIRDGDDLSEVMLGSEANSSALAPTLQSLRLTRWGLEGADYDLDHLPLLHLKKLKHLRYLGVFNYRNRENNLAEYITPTSRLTILDAVECMPELRAFELCGIYDQNSSFLQQLSVRFTRAVSARESAGDGQHPLEHLKLDMGVYMPSSDAMKVIVSVLGKLISVDLKARWPSKMKWSWMKDAACRGKLQYISISADGNTLEPHREALTKLACSIIKACPALRFCDVGTSFFTPADIKLLAAAAKEAEEACMQSHSRPLPTITIGEGRYIMRSRRKTGVSSPSTAAASSIDTSTLIPKGARLKFSVGQRETSPIVSQILESLSSS